MDESYGRDIGSEVPLCLLEAVTELLSAFFFEERPKTLSCEAWEQGFLRRFSWLRCSEEDWKTAAEALDRCGGHVMWHGALPGTASCS